MLKCASKLGRRVSQNQAASSEPKVKDDIRGKVYKSAMEKNLKHLQSKATRLDNPVIPFPDLLMEGWMNGKSSRSVLEKQKGGA